MAPAPKTTVYSEAAKAVNSVVPTTKLPTRW
jgi:hypothetical protein